MGSVMPVAFFIQFIILAVLLRRISVFLRFWGGFGGEKERQ